MIVECERDTYGTRETGLFIRGASYDVDPHDPWAIHFKFPPKERLIAIQEHRKRVAEAKERKDRLAQKKAAGMIDEFDKDELDAPEPEGERAAIDVEALDAAPEVVTPKPKRPYYPPKKTRKRAKKVTKVEAVIPESE